MHVLSICIAMTTSYMHYLRSQGIEPRIYKFREIAQRYYPHLSPLQASRRLRHLINSDALLLGRLLSCGYRAGYRLLTPSMIVCLLELIGSFDEL